MAEIESDVPIPVATERGRPFKRVYPFKDMKVGDSMFYAMPDGAAAKRRRPVHAAYKYGQRSGKRFVSRSVEGGIRIWRVE